MAISPNPAELTALIASLIPDNEAGLITPAAMRQMLSNLVSSMEDYSDADNLTDGAALVIMTVGERSKLAGMTAGAEPNPATVSQAEAEAGTSSDLKSWTPQRVRQAIESLAGIRAKFFNTLQAANFSASEGRIYPIDTSGGGVFVTPPASPSAGQQFGIVDATRSFSTNNCTIQFGSSSQLFSKASVNLALTNSDRGVIFEYMDGTIGWVVVSGSV